MKQNERDKAKEEEEKEVGRKRARKRKQMREREGDQGKGREIREEWEMMRHGQRQKEMKGEGKETTQLEKEP